MSSSLQSRANECCCYVASLFWAQHLSMILLCVPFLHSLVQTDLDLSVLFRNVDARLAVVVLVDLISRHLMLW